MESTRKRNSGVTRVPGNGVQAESLLPHISSAAETVVCPPPGGKNFTFLNILILTLWESSLGTGLEAGACEHRVTLSLPGVVTNLPP